MMERGKLGLKFAGQAMALTLALSAILSVVMWCEASCVYLLYCFNDVSVVHCAVCHCGQCVLCVC